MTLEEIRRVAIYEMGFNPRKDDNVDLLARFAIAVLDALGEERTYARQIWEANRGLVNALEWAGRLSAIDGVRASIVRRLK